MLNTKEIEIVKDICNEMVRNIDSATLAYILSNPSEFEDGLMENERFWDELPESDINQVTKYAKDYLTQII